MIVSPFVGFDLFEYNVTPVFSECIPLSSMRVRPENMLPLPVSGV
jgi:hypothetical protein